MSLKTGPIRHPNLHATCCSQNDMFNVHRGLEEMNALEIVHLDYVIVDTCPENAPDDLKRSRVEPEALEDHLFVSSSDNSVFLNAKCAECNEVYSYRKWTQLLYNKNATHSNLKMGLNALRVNWLANTYLFCLPPVEGSNVIAAYQCMTNRHTVCPEKTWTRT